MYPLPVNLVALDDAVAQLVRRELLNYPATIEAEFRDAQSLFLEYRTKKQTPHLVVVQIRSEKDLGELKRLNGNLAGWPLIALMSSDCSTTELLRANRAGAGQIVLIPPSNHDFNEALRCIGLQFGFISRASSVVAVTGSTGGSGATTLALALAAEAAHLHKIHSILIELGMQIGVVSSYLDIEPRMTFPDLLRDLDRLDSFLVQQSLTHVADRFDILPGPNHLTSPLPVSAETIFEVVDHTRRMAEFIVLDVPCNYGDLQFDVMARADQIVLVAEQSIPSIRSIKLMLDTLRSQRREIGVFVVINRYDPQLEGFKAVDLARLLRVPQVFTVSIDSLVKQASNQGRLLRVVAPRSAALADIDHLLCQLLGVDQPAPITGSSGSGLFAKLVNAFRT